jgi:hypothetical protein
MPDVDVDKCGYHASGVPTPTPTKAPTKALTDVPTTTTKEVCQFADGTPGTKCDGLDACLGIDTSKIGCGSCNGGNACKFGNKFGNGTVSTDKVNVGENSCNGLMACLFHINPVVQSGGNVGIGKQSW